MISSSGWRYNACGANGIRARLRIEGYAYAIGNATSLNFAAMTNCNTYWHILCSILTSEIIIDGDLFCRDGKFII